MSFGTSCPHCMGDVLATRTGDGVRLPYGAAPPRFVVTAHCPHPSCSRLVAARSLTKHEPHSSFGNALDGLVPLEDALEWSPLALLLGVKDWSWPCALLLAFVVIPVWGASEAWGSIGCGGPGWLFFLAGTFLSLVPVIYVTRALVCLAMHGLREARHDHERVRSGAAGGMRLVAEVATYRG